MSASEATKVQSSAWTWLAVVLLGIGGLGGLAAGHAGHAAGVTPEGRLEGESYTALDGGCDPDFDGEHTRVMDDARTSAGQYAFAPHAGCGLTYDVDLATATRFTGFCSLDDPFPANLRVLADGTEVASAARLVGTGNAFVFNAFPAPASIAAGHHTLRVEYANTGSAPEWINLYLDYLRTDAPSSDPLPPAPSGLLAATGPGRGEVSLAWERTGNDCSTIGYRIYRGDAPGEETLLRQVGTVPSFVDSGLPDGAVRWYRVSAVGGSGEGPRSAEVMVSAPSLPGAPASLQARPDAPSLSAGRVRLAWDAPLATGGIPLLGYHVYRGTGVGDERDVGFTTARAFTDTPGTLLGLPDATATYHYRVTAGNAVGQGPASAEACSASSPWPAGLAPALGNPCPAADGTTERTLADETVPLAVDEATPAVDEDVLQVAGAMSSASTYTLRASLAGQELPPITVFTGGVALPRLDAALLHLPGVAVEEGASVRIVLAARSTPLAPVCLVAVGDACTVALPTDPTRPQDTGNALVVRAEVRDQEGRILAQQGLAVPLVGQAVAALP
ncbi:MAG: hypothetical protein LC624_07760 [Halobacteriales archaeon]|nr:hypothetical protein [Halobacteriales archaeon]